MFNPTCLYFWTLNGHGVSVAPGPLAAWLNTPRAHPSPRQRRGYSRVSRSAGGTEGLFAGESELLDAFSCDLIGAAVQGRLLLKGKFSVFVLTKGRCDFSHTRCGGSWPLRSDRQLTQPAAGRRARAVAAEVCVPRAAVTLLWATGLFLSRGFGAISLIYAILYPAPAAVARDLCKRCPCDRAGLFIVFFYR